MEQALSILETAFAKTFGAALGAAIVYGALFLLVLLLAAPVYFVLKRRASGRVEFRLQDAPPRDTLRFHDEAAPAEEPSAGGEPTPAAFGAQPGGAARPELLERLDSVDRVVTTVYEYMIYFAIAAMTGLAVFFYLILPDDGNRDFLIFYGGALYLLGMLWATGQLWFVRRRRRPDPRSIASALSALRSKIDFTIESSPQVFSLDDAALERAAQHLAGGGTLDEACALVVPQYAGMNGIVKGILRKAVEAALEARRRVE